MLHAMIMAGGGGTRFWPRSRQRRPKQFLSLTGDRTLIQLALERIEALVPPDRTWVITAEAYRQETKVQLPALALDHIIGEPCGRDTAPCIALGASLIARQDPEAVMLVTPADHVIEPMQEFRRSVLVAEQVAAEHPSSLITFGIPPTFAATGYGYIHRGREIARHQGVSVRQVRAFKEKPKWPQAVEFFGSGEYFWNSGIFVWRAATVLEVLHDQRPALSAAVGRIADAWPTPQREAVLAQEYPALDKVSIDLAVMENAPEVLVIEAPYRWDDVGSWLALERLQAQDADRNTVQGEHCGLRTEHCVIVSDPGHIIATLGVKDLLIIQDGEVTLIADRSEEGNIKELVELLRQKRLEKHL